MLQRLLLFPRYSRLVSGESHASPKQTFDEGSMLPERVQVPVETTHGRKQASSEVGDHSTYEDADELARLHPSTAGIRHAPGTCTGPASRAPFSTTPSLSDDRFALPSRTEREPNGN